MNTTEAQDTPSSATEVMDWEEALRLKSEEQARKVAAISTSKKFVSFKSGRLSVDKILIPSNKLECVILAFTQENAWYKNKFDSSTSQTPVCWSVFNGSNEMIPDPTSKELQAKDCAKCPKYEWGSDPAGGRGKACKTRYRLCLVPAGDLNAAFRFATLPVTSGVEFEEFLSKISLNYGKPSFAIYTELEVFPDDRYQYVVKLKPIGVLPPEGIKTSVMRIDAAEKAVMYPYVEFIPENGSDAPSKVERPATPSKVKQSAAVAGVEDVPEF